MQRMEEVGAVVVGSGVVGLACARALAQRGIDTLILERHKTIGSETSARNSEVLHAGLYYPTGSWKARLCVAGRRMLEDYCDQHGIARRRCGKLIVAKTDEQAKLLALRDQGEANGVDDLTLLDAAALRRLEPELNADSALLSPSTGIIDSHALLWSLLADAERAGATLVRGCRLAGGSVSHAALELYADGLRWRSPRLVNAAGLSAVAVAASLDGFPAASLPRPYFAKGNYFALRGRAPFVRLIYPLPGEGGLGVHLTLDLAGQARFGPDVEWLAGLPAEDARQSAYRVDAARGAAFAAEIRRYWPGLPDDALTPAFAGIRPKLAGPGAPSVDFLLQGPAQHGIAGLVNLFGIESPGLTASLAIAEQVCQELSFA